ncbi:MULTISPECIES: tRNA (adenine-N1)-methyltransferase [Kocuria]|uniref:tRNA (Adenine-N1)-methyltransferase n=1 Tax=Kocuria subflava TaxID=1736139 RepID=A0A846TSL7_9MICC|nr:MULTISPECIES: tRNA (adenine-N1)-methyltransferase [Kocuria]NKE09809.1 tRNA (adenine-N1)-methyltransferase [Kocuria subflava]
MTQSHTQPTGAINRRGPMREGERIQLTDDRGKLTTITLTVGAEYQTHKGVLPHDLLIGQPEGTVVQNSVGIQYQALRPLMKDFVLSMPRGAAVVYPKDAGQIVTMGDIFPGARVVEAGVGSGALTIALLRAVGDEGTVHSFERREEFAEVAAGNIATMFGGSHPAWQLSIGDLAEELGNAEAPGSVDRVVLDMLAPWECLDAVAQALTPGGVVICYVATVTQLSRTAEAMRTDGRFTEPDAHETMVRGWHVEGLAVRPDHRMVAHTGFLITARRLADGAPRLAPKRRASKSDYTQEDLQAWTPVALGEREVSDKKARRASRDAQHLAQRAAVADSHARNDSQETHAEGAGTPATDTGTETEAHDDVVR